MSGGSADQPAGLYDPAAWAVPVQPGVPDTRQAQESFTQDRSPGSDWHLTMLMAPLHLNLVVGSDRDALLAFGRAVWTAAVQDHVSQRRGR